MPSIMASLVGCSSAVITDFFAAAFNPSIFARYTHTVDALLIMGAFVAMAVAGWYMLKGRHAEFAMKTMPSQADTM